MKMKTLKPLLLGGKVVVEGKSFETTELHGRELLQRGYAELDKSKAVPVVKITEEPGKPGFSLTSDLLSSQLFPSGRAAEEAEAAEAAKAAEEAEAAAAAQAAEEAKAAEAAKATESSKAGKGSK